MPSGSAICGIKRITYLQHRMQFHKQQVFLTAYHQRCKKFRKRKPEQLRSCAIRTDYLMPSLIPPFCKAISLQPYFHLLNETNKNALFYNRVTFI